MPQPTQQMVHVDKAMSNVSIAYSNAEYIGTKVFPAVQVGKETDEYFIYEKGDWFRDEATQRAPGQAPNVAGFNLSTCPYVCINYAIRTEVPDEVRDNADEPIQPNRDAVEFGTNLIELALERRIASLVTTVGGWANSTSPTTQWGTDTSDPFTDIKTGVATVRNSIGKRPNTIVMGAEVWDELMIHPDLVARAQYTILGGLLQPDQLGKLYNIPQVLIGESIYNTAGEDVTVSMSNIWGKNLWIGYVAPTATLKTATAGITIRWNARQVNRHRIDDEYKTVFDVQEYTDEVRTASDAGYLIESAVA